MHFRSNPRKKRSQIGALSAANCRLTPNQIELKISRNDESSCQESKIREEKDVLTKEIQVIQSKKGMVADISRTFSSALTHKTNLIRRTGGGGPDKQATRIGGHQLQATDQSQTTAA